MELNIDAIRRSPSLCPKMMMMMMLLRALLLMIVTDAGFTDAWKLFAYNSHLLNDDCVVVSMLITNRLSLLCELWYGVRVET